MDASLTPDTLLDGAQMYAASADAINEKLPNSFHVLSHCLAISIELALKAYLRSHGQTEKDLRTVGHDLAALLKEACSFGLDYTGSRNYVLSVAGHNYKKRLFSYPENGNIVVIMPWRLRQMADELIRVVFVHLYGCEKYEESKHEPGLQISSKYPEDICATNWKTPEK